MTDRLAPKRWPALDAARGLALAAMFIFHLCWDLTYFHLIPRSLTDDPAFHGFGHAIAASFVIIAGIGLTLAARGGLDLYNALIRIGLIALAALGITAVTYLIFPDAFIWFGILHLIALASVLSLPLLHAPAVLISALAMTALGLPLIISAPAFDAMALQWLGLGTHPPITNDWRPLLPWFGVMLIGVLGGRIIAEKGLTPRLDNWQPQSALSRALVWSGRRTLLIYLAHQPILFALVFIGATFTAPRGDDILAAQSDFMRGCETQCVATGGEAVLCTRACSCVAQEATSQGMGRAVARNQLTPDEQKKFNDITKTCLRRLMPPSPEP
jgi:uncharacterized membrane protein